MSTMTKNDTQKPARNNNDTGLRSGIGEVKKDAHAVKEDLEVLKEDTAQLAAHATSQAIEAVKVGAKSAGEVATNSGEKLKQYHGAMTEQVKARPTASVLLALGAGVMIGRVLAATRR
ncbi:MAG: hypothetical protein ACF8MF_01140 [Phycisphaerales bacterium JB052]